GEEADAGDGDGFAFGGRVADQEPASVDPLHGAAADVDAVVDAEHLPVGGDWRGGVGAGVPFEAVVPAGDGEGDLFGDGEGAVAGLRSVGDGHAVGDELAAEPGLGADVHG